jgi:hypothetical protein
MARSRLNLSSVRTSGALVPYAEPPRALVPFGHKFPALGEQRSGVVSGTGRDTVLSSGTRLFQSQVPSRFKGKSYSRKPTDFFKTGISPYGNDTVHNNAPPGGVPPIALANNAGFLHLPSVTVSPKRKKIVQYATLTDVPAYESVAAPVLDTWSIPGLPVSTSGTQDQLFIDQIRRIGHLD